MQEKLTKNQHGTRSILLVFVEVTEIFDSVLSSSGLASWDCFEIWHWSDLPNFWQSSSCWKLRMYLPRWWWCRTPQKGHHHKHHKQENTTNTTKRTSPQTPQTPQTGEHHKHHKKDITANTTNRRTPQTPPDPRKIQPDLNCRRRLLHGPGAATRRRGGTSGSNRGPATTSWASRAVAEIRQRHRGPVRLHKNLTKASGTGEIAQPGEHHSQESSRFLSVNSRFP